MHSRVIVVLGSLLALVGGGTAMSAFGQGSSTSAPVAPPAGEQPDFSPEELEQLMAPIALYPDSLLSQILMASTYPVEVVEAERWAKENASLKGGALAQALEQRTWDPSVKSLVEFPDVLAMMSQNLSTTVKIGDAFIGQQKETMAAIQRLRAKAKGTGNLASTPEQRVETKTDAGTEVIVIESSSPEVIYVPQYNPTVVYGSWPYPAYPPYPYYPPGYVASNLLSFGVGVACGVAWGYAWGNCNWGGGDVDIDINRNANFNRQIDRSKYAARGERGTWQHDPAHRQGASYRNAAAADRAGAARASDRAAQSRNEFRGRADAGRRDIAAGGADSVRGGAGDRGARPSAQPAQRGGARNDGGRQSGFSGAQGGGPAAREASQRGSTSRASPASRGSPSRAASAPSRSGGGGARSGGSRGGGGRGGRR